MIPNRRRRRRRRRAPMPWLLNTTKLCGSDDDGADQISPPEQRRKTTTMATMTPMTFQLGNRHPTSFRCWEMVRTGDNKPSLLTSSTASIFLSTSSYFFFLFFISLSFTLSSFLPPLFARFPLSNLSASSISVTLQIKVEISQQNCFCLFLFFFLRSVVDYFEILGRSPNFSLISFKISRIFCLES